MVILQIMRVEPKELKEKVAGMLIISIVMFIIVFIWPGSFGGGDIKLMAICGLLLGQEKILRAGWLALLTASMYSVLFSHYIKKGPRAEIALGPFISIGVLGVFLDIF